MTYPHLDRAPITEALVDLQVELSPNVTIETLARMHEALRDSSPAYPPFRLPRRATNPCWWNGHSQIDA